MSDSDSWKRALFSPTMFPSICDTDIMTCSNNDFCDMCSRHSHKYSYHSHFDMYTTDCCFLLHQILFIWFLPKKIKIYSTSPNNMIVDCWQLILFYLSHISVTDDAVYVNLNIIFHKSYFICSELSTNINIVLFFHARLSDKNVSFTIQLAILFTLIYFLNHKPLTKWNSYSFGNVNLLTYYTLN